MTAAVAIVFIVFLTPDGYIPKMVNDALPALLLQPRTGPMSNFAAARLNMVESQIRPNKIIDFALIEALRSVPRELFVPKAIRSIAYRDEDLAISPGRYLMEPLVLARMVQEAAVAPGDVVLDVGCGTGYSTAVLARLAATVVGLESDQPLARQASDLLRTEGVDNAVVMEGSLSGGYAKQAPYNAIIINGAVNAVPPALFDQLADGGRLVAVLRDGGPVGEMRLFLKSNGYLSSRAVATAGVPALPGFVSAPTFTF